MSGRLLTGAVCVLLTASVAWLGGRGGDKKGPAAWTAVHPGVQRSAGEPSAYALIDGDAALLIDAPAETAAPPGKKIELVLLTHHHRDSCGGAGALLAAGVKVRAPKASAEWLTPDAVKKYWQESVPLRGSRTAYLVVPVGLDGIDCSLAGGEVVKWRGWTITVVATPGHSRDHVAYLARKGDGPLLLFCGDAFVGPGKLWSPYTTDWDHWTDQGLKPAAESLRKLAALKPAALLPAHGEVVLKDPAEALTKTAAAVEEVGFLKSFERFTKQRLGKAPEYKFLAKEQAESNGSKPWSRVSDHLWITGNTYVLVSRDNACLVVDPWDKRSADQVAKLRADQKLGPVEVVMFSHAHFDHYDGVYHLPDRDKFEVWTLDQVAVPIAEPLKLRAPFLDARPVRIDRKPKDGDALTWREFRFRFHHFPGQTEYTMGVEAVIDGKKCFFTADNFFHQDMFSGSGGWMGLNRSFPLPYAASAKKVLDAAPDWVLAEHGGPFEFSAEDFRRRVQWGEACAVACDALSPSAAHRHDWDPHRVAVDPLVVMAKPGAKAAATLVVSNPLGKDRKLTVTLEGRGLVGDHTWDVEIGAGKTARREVALVVGEKTPVGRHVFALRVTEDGRVDPCDAFVVLEVSRDGER
jgi:glyoxylase-like metal-dependent hydrolase (beta-lactamase superfamily II)